MLSNVHKGVIKLWSGASSLSVYFDLN
ncbi:hypothetical protein BN1263300109 [Stenotrophomonas maltophilia]|nr:hypothetical protein BN1263300109 [Stenotrophomonas maltophilia]